MKRDDLKVGDRIEKSIYHDPRVYSVEEINEDAAVILIENVDDCYDRKILEFERLKWWDKVKR